MIGKKRVGVLISGRGSNLAALIDACRDPDCPAEIVIVIANVATARGLHYARDAGIAAQVIDHRVFESRDAFDGAITDTFVRANVDLVCNAGFMRLHSRSFVNRWQGRQLNIHPSLLPAFKGLHPQRQALEAGVRISGCTVHFVSEDVDAGAIIAQAAVPVYTDDDEEGLSARILAAEHSLYPHALSLVAEGNARLEGGRTMYRLNVVGAGEAIRTPDPHLGKVMLYP